MNGKQLAAIVLATIFLAYCIQETEASFKLKKLIKAGIILKALSPRKIILPIPIPIPIGIHKEQHHHHHGHGGGHHGGGFPGEFHGGHYGGHYGSYGHGGYDYGHSGYNFHSSGYHLEHGW